MAYMIGIAGGSGSGKTTFTQKILKQLSQELSVLHMDSYYLENPEKIPKTDSGKTNFDHPDAFDWDLLYKHTQQLKKGEQVQSPTYDFKTSHREPEQKTLLATPVILIEGLFCFYHKEILNLLDIKCFLHVEADIRFTRRLHRDLEERGRNVESIIDQYYDTVRPMYEKFLSPQKQYADIIVGEETDIAAEIISSKIRELI